MRRLVVVAALIALWPGAAVAQGDDQPPVVREIRATFSFPVTTYVVTAEDPEGGPLSVLWFKSPERECGEFTFEGNTARWSHPHPPCPEESFHPGTITVRVSDGSWELVAEYPHGSEEGVVTFEGLRATPVPTTGTSFPTTAPTTAGTSTTTTAVGETLPIEEDDGGSFPIALVVGGLVGAAIIAGWLLARRGGGDPCAELRRRCEEATRAMHEAGRALDAAVAETAAARDRDQQARDEVARASRPPSEEAWIESDGVRVTQHDLALRMKAAAEAWRGYSSGTATAAEVEQQWRDLDAPGAREQRRADDAAARAQRLADAQAAATAAADALAAAEAAQAAAADAYAAAVAAQREACAAAAACEREAAATPPPTAAPTGGPTSAPPPPTPTPTPTPPPPPPASTPEEPSEEPLRCGPDLTDAFVFMLNTTLTRLRTERPKSFGDSALNVFGDLFLGGWGPRSSYGLLFMFENGNNMDFWADYTANEACPSNPRCQRTITLLGTCVAPHTTNDSLYGMVCGFWGLESFIAAAGGQYAEWDKKGGPGWGGLNLDPQVSRDLYDAGIEIGLRAWDDDTYQVTRADLQPIVDVATKHEECPICLTPGPGKKDFSVIQWVWPSI